MYGQRTQWIAAIRESPEDNALRLAYAAWLEEQGDETDVARAEFIRVQIQRGKLADNDPRQSELQARELRLLKYHAREWCGVHFAFKKVRFRRGFIEYVHLHLQHFLQHRRQLFDLEPVRDLSLTGWYRASDDLIRRAAACDELQFVETLRIHHQGPHKDPRSNVVLLLESPYLTRLRALHCSRVQFDAEGRRRFERLPVLRNLLELKLPYLDSLVQPERGSWFEDGGLEFVGEWSQLRSLSLPLYLASDTFRHLTSMPFWDHLTELEMWHGSIEDLRLLSERLPQSLTEFALTGDCNCVEGFAPFKSVFERLRQVPLQSLRLSYIGIPPKELERLTGTNRWGLTELSLFGCKTSKDRATVLASSPGLAGLRSLAVTSDLSFDGPAARALLSSPVYASLVHLSLFETRAGNMGAKALAGSGGMQQLRSLDLGGAGIDTASFRTLIKSANFRGLTWLSLSDCGCRDDPAIDLSADLAKEIAHLPRLSALGLYLRHCDARSQEMLSGADGVPWTWICCGDKGDIQDYRAALAPERWPPVDIRWPNRWAGWHTENGGAPV